MKVAFCIALACVAHMILLLPANWMGAEQYMSCSGPIFTAIALAALVVGAISDDIRDSRLECERLRSRRDR